MKWVRISVNDNANCIAPVDGEDFLQWQVVPGVQKQDEGFVLSVNAGLQFETESL